MGFGLRPRRVGLGLPWGGMYPESYMEAHGQTALIALIDLSAFPANWQNNQGDFPDAILVLPGRGERNCHEASRAAGRCLLGEVILHPVLLLRLYDGELGG